MVVEEEKPGIKKKKKTTAGFIHTWMVGKQLNTAARSITMQL